MALIECPDCRREVSDLAPACIGCGRPLAGIAPQQIPPPPERPAVLPGILPSNLGTLDDVAPPTQRPQSKFFVPVLVVGSIFVIAVTALALWPVTQPASPATSGVRATAPPRPTPTLVGAAAPNARRPSAVAAPLPAVNDISCDALESTIFHIHVHLAIFINGNEQLVPFGVGIGQPWQVQDSDEGPFVTDGSCFYWVHTHTEDGVIHIESPIRRTFTLGDFFDIWQQPLSATQVGPIQGAVITYVNGSRDATNPSEIRLLSHQRIQLDVGQDVPPYPFDFPPGD